VNQFQGTCVKQESISKSVFRTTFQTELTCKTFLPGQFVQLRARDSCDPLLRRPFSIHRIHTRKNTFDLLYRIVGMGTSLISESVPGDVFNIVGPLGNGFQLDGSFSHAVIVVGGMGSAPAFFLMDRLLHAGKKVTLFWGARDKSEIFDLLSLRDQNVDVRIATEDGSLGKKGLVTNLLKSFINKKGDESMVRGFICGPEGMLKSVQSMILKSPASWQVSLEERMACGVGVCCGCAITMKSGSFELACKGPVFDLKEVVFHD
jgi:dihydroorotate dehydrogenase electron transfer subunit